MLEIADPVVANFIIDQRGIEGILLFQKSADARNVMKSNAPKGFREAYTIEGDQILSHPTFRYYSAEKSTAQLLTASLEDVIKQFQKDLSQQRSQLQQVKMTIRKLDDDLKNKSSEKQNLDSTLHNLRKNTTKNVREMNELKNFEEPQPIDVTTLEAEANELNSKLEDLDKSITAEMEKVSKAKNDCNEAEKSVNDIEQLIRNATEGLDPIKSRFEELGNELETAKQHRKHYAMKSKEHETRLQQLQQEYDTKMADIQSDRQKALQICEEIGTSRKAQNIENEIKQIERQIAVEERTHGNRDEIMKTYHEKRKVYEDVKREMNLINNFLQKLNKTLSMRNIWFQRARNSLTLRTKLFFMNNLAARNYSGKLNVSHKNETIEPIVYPMTAAEGSEIQGSTNKSLSGGERSFSTACFILALWDGMHSPFRCLDEYDVFMDMVNRRITMDMMMKFATEKKGSQFIFLSPLDMSGILQVNQLDVKIFEMHPPEREMFNDKENDED